MGDPTTDGARAAAKRLSAELGSGIVPDVEAALHARGESQRPEQYVDPISLGGLVVSVASLAWTIYKDLKRKTPTPPPEVVARTVRVKIREAEATAPAQRDHIIDVVVSETLAAAETTAGDA
jgi:hypothetical protein